MDIEKLLEHAQKFCADAIEPGHTRTGILSAQNATACATTALAMIAYERWQNERLEVERAEMVALYKIDPPF
jgi:hypothetical protein